MLCEGTTQKELLTWLLRCKEAFSPHDRKKESLRHLEGESKTGDIGPTTTPENTRKGNDPLGFDWENYTMGSLAIGRSTYDFSHRDFLRVKE